MAAFPAYGNLTYNSNLGGSTGTKLFRNTADKKWVVKKAEAGGGFSQIQTEAVVDDIYAALGVPVPKHILDTENKALILEHIDGVLLAYVTDPPELRETVRQELCKGFIVDALLANWDVIGLYNDNIIVPSDGTPPVRIDNGGSLTFKATGGNKPFGETVGEIDTMRNKKISPQAAAIFGKITDTEIDEQIKTIIVPNYDLILSLTPEALRPTMAKRMDNLIERTVWTNASKFKNAVVETATPEYLPEVQKAVVKYFKQGWETHYNTEGEGNNSTLLAYVNSVLQENEAVISGGFILKAIGSFVDEASVDMDIYVPTKNAEKFRATMSKLFNAQNVIKHVVSNAPGSFFKKNGILSVTKYSKDKPKYAEMDIVEVNADRTPIDVVKNFDLTFCENWYDGKQVFMTYPVHVKTKHGFLENHYLALLKEGNPILKKRMKKYISRGFKISIHNPASKANENITNGIVANTLFKSTAEVQNKPNNEYTSYGIKKKSKTGAQGAPNTRITNQSLLNSITTEIEPSVRPVVANSVSIANYNDTLNINSTFPVVNRTILTAAELSAIFFYATNGSSYINRFLYTSDVPYYKTTNFINALRQKFPRADGQDDRTYANLIAYYAYVNLYNGIQKGLPFPSTFFKVYRGTSAWYLHEVSDRFYYMNSFVSTSTRTLTANSFGGTAKKYIFFVHSACRYMNLINISPHRSEKEILLTPYHRYLYIRTEGNAKCYIVLPTDLDIPGTFETFMPWKSTVIGLSRNIMVGGRNATLLQDAPFFNMNNTVNRLVNSKQMNTRKKLNNTKSRMRSRNTAKMNNTRKQNAVNNISSVNTIKNNTASDTSRFTDPIPSFPGKPPTASEMKMVEVIKAIIEKDIAKGTL